MANKKSKYADIPSDVSPNTIVMVQNGFHGKMVYVSKKTKEEFEWDSFGDEQEMDLRELKNAKSSQKSFFENNWFMFDDEDSWVIPYLGLTKYYDNSLSLKEMDEIFAKSPTEIKKKLASIPKGQKDALIFKARELVRNDAIDSLKVISVLEDGLGISLKQDYI